MEPYPGRMATVEQSCGQTECHWELIPILKNSLMYTVDGMISVTRKVYDEKAAKSVDLPLDLRLSEQGADSYLRKLCVSCHLGTDRKSHLQTLRDRGGGCAACHLRSYRKIERERLVWEEDGLVKVFGPAHPTLDVSIPTDRCFGCHSRSGRISLNYIGWAEADRIDQSRKRDFGFLPDKRLVEKKQPDIHSVAGMACIDCHTANGVMGTGKRHARQQEQVDIQCIDCHFPEGDSQCKANCGSERPLASLKRREIIYLSLYAGKVPPPKEGNTFATLRHRTPLLHVQKEGETIVMHTKLTRQKLEIPRIKRLYYHTMVGHARLSCDSCHSGWAPQCYGCHVSFDPKGRQYDHLKGRETPGRWSETRWQVMAELPALGVTGSNKIAPFIPGMHLTVEKGKGVAPITKGLFSFTSPHTTQKQGRSCESCHQSDSALGIIEKWTVAPQNPAWKAPVGWVEEGSSSLGKATQPAARSFTGEEMAKIRKVGICLECHSGETAIFEDYKRSLGSLSKLCRTK